MNNIWAFPKIRGVFFGGGGGFLKGDSIPCGIEKGYPILGNLKGLYTTGLSGSKSGLLGCASRTSLRPATYLLLDSREWENEGPYIIPGLGFRV